MFVNQMTQFMADNETHLLFGMFFQKAGVENDVMRFIFNAIEIRCCIESCIVGYVKGNLAIGVIQQVKDFLCQSVKISPNLRRQRQVELHFFRQTAILFLIRMKG